MRNNKKEIITSVALSCTAHVVFLAFAYFYVLPGISQSAIETKKLFHVEGVDKKPVDVDLAPSPGEPIESVKMKSPVLMEEAIEFPNMMYQEKPEEKTEKTQRGNPAADMTEEEIKFTTEDMAEVEGAMIREEVSPQKKPILGRMIGAPDETASPKEAPGSESGSEMARQYFTYPVSPSGQMAVPVGSGGGAYAPGEGELSAIEGSSRVGRYADINKFLDVVLSTYEDPATKEKYFKLEVSVKEGIRFKSIPKEIIFLVDSSKSITEEKLSFFKAGVLNALRDLNPGDKVNVVAFREGPIEFKPDSLNITEKPSRELDSFVKNLESVGQTDVNGALLKIAERPLTFKPSYVILMTDGRPTVGEMDPKKIIQDLTRENNMARPIFSYGGGFRVNRYLLEFVAYQNRGWAGFASSAADIAKDFRSFFAQIKDPILLDVRYRVNKIDSKQIFPKYLPDFYLKRPFTLYGRYTDEDVFSMQILGELEGEVKELLFSVSLKNAEKGTADMPTKWAFSKIYYLISQLTMGKGDPAQLRAEIDELSKKYGIVTPYDLDDKVK